MSQFTHTIKRGGALSVIMTILALYTPYAHAAETCVAAPSCSELGYTLTSTTNCASTPLKCPFDKTKYFCTLKSEVAYAASPDYSKAINRSANTTYTAETNGVIFGGENQRANAGDGKDAQIDLFINGVNVRNMSNAQINWSSNSWSYPVRKGSTYKLNLQSRGAETWLNFKFVPTN